MNHKGFTIIETIIGIALLAVIMGSLGTAVYQTVKVFLDSNDYKTAGDYSFEHIQSTDDTGKTNDTNWKIASTYTKTYKDDQGATKTQTDTTTDPIQITSFKNSKSIAKNQVQLNTFITTIGTKISYSYLSNVQDNNSAQEISELTDKGITSFDDLPDPSYSALNQSSNGRKSNNEEWGKWSFVGWSGGDLKKYIDNHKRPHKYYYTGDIKIYPLREQNINDDWKGLVTRDNFDDFINFVNEKLAIDPSYKPKLKAAYIFSKDVDGSLIEGRMLLGDENNNSSTTQNTRRQRDIDNLQNLSSMAASILKEEKGVLSSNFDDNGLNAVTGYGIEILHFRENGWPVLAQNRMNNDSYHSGNLNDNATYYEKTKGYNNYYKVGTYNSYTGGIDVNNRGTTKTGFLDRVFYEGIGFNLGLCGHYNDYGRYHGINYDYNTLLFGNDILTDSEPKISIYDSETLSLYMKINQERRNDNKYNVTVTTWVGTVSNPNNNNYSMTILHGYSASASFVSTTKIY